MDKENLENQLENNPSFDTTKSHSEEEYISLQARFRVCYTLCSSYVKPKTM